MPFLACEIAVLTNRPIKWLANVVLRTEPLIVKLALTFFTQYIIPILLANPSIIFKKLQYDIYEQKK